MAQADGVVLIDTEINADGMEAGSKEVEAAVRKMASTTEGLSEKAKTALNKQVDAFVKLNNEFSAQAKKVDELKRKVAEYGDQKIPTDEYKEIQSQITKLNSQMDKAIDNRKRFLDTGGKQSSTTYRRMTYDINLLNKELEDALLRKKELEKENKAFTFGNQTKQAAADMEKLAAAERKLSDMNNRLGTSYSSIKGKVNEYSKNLLKADSSQKKASASGKKLTKSLKDTGKAANSANFGLGKMLGKSILFSAVFQAISAVTNGIKEGFTNLAQYSGSTNNSISMLWSSLERLKNSLATAFAPILDVVAPILSRFIDMLSTAASYVSMFFSYLSGKGTYTKAIAVQKNYAASLQDTASGAADAAKETNAAAEAAEDYLSPLDDLNRYTDTSKSASPVAGSGNNGMASGPMFEEVEITDIPILEKVKGILEGLFTPFKQAWEAEGQATIDAAMFALQNLGELAGSIGKSFYEVWTNGTGTQTLSLILQIAQNVLNVIGNIAERLNEAWNTNNLGTQIIQNIFNLFNSILGTIERILGATAEWAAKLNFTPLLTSVNTFFEALQPFTDTIGEGLEWFWNNVLLPIAGWTIQEAVPVFLEMLAAAIGVLNDVLVALQPLGQWLWDSFLQPLAAWTGDLIIAAMQVITDLLQKFGDWVSEHQGIVQTFAIILGSFAAAWGLVTAAVTIWNTVGAIAATVTGALGTAITFLTSPIGIAIAIIGALIAVGVLLYKNWDSIKEGAIQIWGAIRDWFASVVESIGGFFSGLWDGIVDIFSGVGDWFGDVFSGAWENTKTAWSNVGSFFSNAWESTKKAFSGTSEWFGNVFSNAWKNTKTAWGNVGNFFSNTWKSIQNAFSNVSDWFKNVFSRAWEAVKNVFSTGGRIFDGIKDGILSGLKSVINGLIRGINKVVSIPFSGLNAALRTLRKLSIFGVKPFSWLPTISTPQIPYLASGAVIPPNREFLAVLGDQTNGNNIEAPEGLIRRIVREETQGNNNGSYTFIAQLDGKVLFRETISAAKLMQMQTGRNPYELA